MLLPTSDQMRQIDSCAINRFHIPSIVLMENAGLGTVRALAHRFGLRRGRLVPIFIGPGNNGGDGLVIARHLHQCGAVPLPVFLVDPGRLKGDAAVNLRIVELLGLPTITGADSGQIATLPARLQALEMYHGAPAAFVDAIFGTGLERPIEGHFREAIDLLNRMASTRDIPVVAVDTPSGLGSDDGRILGVCVRADLTATYGYAKLGQVLPGSRAYTGDLEVIDIGIPAAVLEQVEVPARALGPDAVSSCTARLRRAADAHKGSFGHLLIIGGSPDKTGAPMLAARGALRSGCGLVSVAAPSGLNSIYQMAMAETMTVLLESEWFPTSDDIDTIEAHLADKRCLVAGPGIGQREGTADLLVALYNRCPLPLVIDADGLNILASRRQHLTPPPGPRILTPHPGEMARLIGSTAALVQSDRFRALQTCFEQFRAGDAELIILLKGSGSLISNGRQLWVNRTGNPAMATAGMGDVLSGLIGSLICQGLPCCEATCFGAHLHGFCGDRLQSRIGVGFSASELADDLSPALKTIIDEAL